MGQNDRSHPSLGPIFRSVQNAHVGSYQKMNYMGLSYIMIPNN